MRNVLNGPGLPWGAHPGAKMLYVYDGKRVIQERDGGSTPTVAYTRGTDLSGSLEGAGGIGGLLARSHAYLSGNWTTHNFYHADGNGNITAMVNSFQGLAASYRYDPFGNTLSKSGSLADANVYRFSSKEFHVNSGLYYFLYRFYDPPSQRWLGRDPISDNVFRHAFLGHRRLRFPAERRLGANLYGFIYNSPMNLVDPLGLQFAPAGAAGTATGATTAGTGTACGPGTTITIVGTTGPEIGIIPIIVGIGIAGGGGYVLGSVICVGRDAEIQPNGVNSWSTVTCSLGPSSRPEPWNPNDKRHRAAASKCRDELRQMEDWQEDLGLPALTEEQKQDILSACMRKEGIIYPWPPGRGGVSLNSRRNSMDASMRDFLYQAPAPRATTASFARNEQTV